MEKLREYILLTWCIHLDINKASSLNFKKIFSHLPLFAPVRVINGHVGRSYSTLSLSSLRDIIDECTAEREGNDWNYILFSNGMGMFLF